MTAKLFIGLLSGLHGVITKTTGLMNSHAKVQSWDLYITCKNISSNLADNCLLHVRTYSYCAISSVAIASYSYTIP